MGCNHPSIAIERLMGSQVFFLLSDLGILSNAKAAETRHVQLTTKDNNFTRYFILKFKNITSGGRDFSSFVEK